MATNWRPIPAFPDYEISDTGEVRSPTGRSFRVYEYDGGAYVDLRNPRSGDQRAENKSTKFQRRTRAWLVLRAFADIKGAFRARHLNGVPTDDRLENLVVTRDYSNRKTRGQLVDAQEGELWAPIPEVSGLYEASSYGRIRRVCANTLVAPYRTGSVKKYLQVKLPRVSKVASFMVHRLVLSAFVGPAPDGHEADHIDRVTTNNTLSNLRWLPREANGPLPHTGPRTGPSLSPARVGAILGVVSVATRYRASQLLGLPQTTVAGVCDGSTELARAVALELGIELPLGAGLRADDAAAGKAAASEI